MFESITHILNKDGSTLARFADGEVSGTASFSSDAHSTRLISCIGPIDAVRECVASHWLSSVRGGYRARVSESVENYA